ncbi:MAG: rod shape-determining protein MreD [Bacilli bacterium]|nr:rod shape-determining protein MreD [Bacilli bacterium]
MLAIIIIIISILLDGILTNYLPYLVNDLSLFTPLLSVVSIFIIYPFYRKKEKNYFITIFIVGIIYDLLYTNLLFFNAVLFTSIAIISRLIYKNFEVTPIRLIIYTTLIITSYEILTAAIILIFNLVPITFSKVLYKITHSLILNIIYIELIYLIIKVIPKKYKNISIN